MSLAPWVRVDLDFYSWPPQWYKEFARTPVWIYASNLPIHEVYEGPGLSPDLRGPMGHIRLPFREGELLEVFLLPLDTVEGESQRCPLRLMATELDNDMAMLLKTAVIGVMERQQIDATEAFASSFTFS